MIVFRTRKDPLVRTVDFRNVVPWEPIEWADELGNVFRAPPFRSRSDLASTPPAIWPKLPPFGTYARACLGHDGGYQDWLERRAVTSADDRLKQARALRDQAEQLMARADELEAGCWTKAHLSKDESDQMLLELMEADQVELKTRDAIYEGVHLFGWRAFRQDRATNL